MTIAQKIAELAEALGVDIPNDGQIADNLNAITLAKGGTITSNTNISEAIKNLANTIGGNDGSSSGGLEEGVRFHYLLTNYGTNMNEAFSGVVTIDVTKHPEIFEGSYNEIMIYQPSIIFHDGTLDKTKIEVDGSTVHLIPDDPEGEYNIIGQTLDYSDPIQINDKYYVVLFESTMNSHVTYDFNGYYENNSKLFSDYEDGTPVCIVLSFPDNKYIIVDGIWHVEGTPYIEMAV